MKSIISFAIISLFILSACSSKTDKEVYESAKKKIDDAQYAEALVEFKSLVKEFPETEYMTDALLEIGKLYHGKVAKNISEEESLMKATKYYRMVFDREPDHVAAPNALFMMGFLQANELNMLDSAKATYQLFLEKYPDNELAFSAKAELESLGIPPEVILKNASEANPE